jgi:VanZ family protein
VLVVSLYVLFAPAQGGPTLFDGSDKVVHLLLFAALAGTGRWRFGAQPALLLGVVAYAVVSEVVQGALLSGRSGDPVDVLADLVGAAAGWVAAGLLLRPPPVS